MRILVYGAGVLGSLYAARLHDADQDVTILARGERLAALERGAAIRERAHAPARRAVAMADLRGDGAPLVRNLAARPVHLRRRERAALERVARRSGRAAGVVHGRLIRRGVPPPWRTGTAR